MNILLQKLSLQKVSRYILYWLLALSLVLIIYSYDDPPIRLLYIFTLLWALFTGVVHSAGALRTIPRVRYTALAMLVLIIGWIAFAGRPVNAAHLRRAYIARLRAFSGVHYFWGGESHFGIDCSGLARIALWEAMLSCGATEANPRYVGASCWSFWWHDVGASDIENGAQGYTHVIGVVPRLAGFETSLLQPGDMAIPGMTTYSSSSAVTGGSKRIRETAKW